MLPTIAAHGSSSECRAATAAFGWFSPDPTNEVFAKSQPMSLDRDGTRVPVILVKMVPSEAGGDMMGRSSRDDGLHQGSANLGIA